MTAVVAQLALVAGVSAAEIVLLADSSDRRLTEDATMLSTGFRAYTTAETLVRTFDTLVTMPTHPLFSLANLNMHVPAGSPAITTSFPSQFPTAASVQWAKPVFAEAEFRLVLSAAPVTDSVVLTPTLPPTAAPTHAPTIAAEGMYEWEKTVVPIKFVEGAFNFPLTPEVATSPAMLASLKEGIAASVGELAPSAVISSDPYIH
jgi:hypothetical protein